MNYKLAFALGLITPGAWSGEQWEVLFEGEVTTSSSTLGNGYEGRALTIDRQLENPFFSAGDVVRLTVGGITQSHTAAIMVRSFVTCTVAGNAYLASKSVEDNGGDYAVLVYSSVQPEWYLDFFSRTPGTYRVKIERKL